LFVDPTSEDSLLKIFNYNRYHSLESGVIGVFNARYENSPKKSKPTSGFIRPADVERLGGVLDGVDDDRFAVFAHNANELRVLKLLEKWEFALAPLMFEVFTIVQIKPSDSGVALASIGLADKFNSDGGVYSRVWMTSTRCEIDLRGGGRFLSWCDRRPSRIEITNDYDEELTSEIEFMFDEATGWLEVNVPLMERPCLSLHFEE
jgi:hypothetical protein